MASRRIAFVDHSYHQKTRSTFFIRDALFPGQAVEDWWDDSWQGGAPIDVDQLIAQGYDLIAVCQVEIVAEMLARRGFRPVIFIPMWDGCKNLPEGWWQALDGFRIVSFCRALHERVRRCGLPSIHVEYYPDPATFPAVSDFAELRGFFWQRHHDLTWHHVLRLVGESRFSKLHFHMAQDPSADLIESPSHTEQERHRITLSRWFEQRGGYFDTLAGSNVYFAPRPSEGIGFSFLEAMAMGMCVVAPDAPTMNEYVTDGVSGLLWDLAQPSALDFSQAAELGRRARDKVALGFQKWLSALPILQEFAEGPNRRFAVSYDSLRFRGGSIGDIIDRAKVRNAYAHDEAATPSVGYLSGGLRTRGFVKRDLAETPLVTIVTVTLNCIDQFEGTIRNVLRQDYPNLEVIVIDGESVDGTLDLIGRYDDYIDLWTSRRDGGPYEAMNTAADLANGRYILFMNAGDWFIGDDAVSNAMHNVPPDADFILGHHIFRQLDGTESMHKANAFESTWQHLTAGELSDSWLGGIPCHQATFTRTQMLRAQRYDTAFRIAADHEFMYRQRLKGARFHHSDMAVSTYVSGGLSAVSQTRCLDEWIAITSKYGSADAAEQYFGPARKAAAVNYNQQAPVGIDLSAELDGLREEVARLRAIEDGFALKRAELDVLHEEVNRLRCIENSSSWKMTYPIRVALTRAPRVSMGLRTIARTVWRAVRL
jgi:Glycosyl transferase family 2/Glycosyl transferases group 1